MTNQKKTALITGAAGGIGRAIATRLATDGYNLVLSDVNEADLAAVAEALPDTGILICPGDLSDSHFLPLLIEQSVNRFCRIDVLINNAAWRTIETMRTISLANWQKAIDVCLTAPAFLAKETAACMEAAGTGGVIINISSMMADRPAGYSPAYIAAKSALEGLTRELSVTYGRSGIRVVAVRPGYIDTALSKNYKSAADASDQTDMLANYIVAATPLQAPAVPQAIADAVSWLSSDQAFFITGTTLTIDGGFTTNMNSYSLKKSLFPDEF